MAQEKILQRDVLSTVKVKKVDNTGSQTEVTPASAVGALAWGKCGDITSKAFGPVVYTVSLKTADGAPKFLGTLHEQDGVVGVLCNGNDIANTAAKFNPSFKVADGQTVGLMTYGTMLTYHAQYASIAAKMNVRIIRPVKTSDYEDGDFIEIELTGAKATA